MATTARERDDLQLLSRRREAEAPPQGQGLEDDGQEIVYDFCMVFKVDPTTGGLSEQARAVTLKLVDAGLNLNSYLSVQNDEVYLLIGASTNRLAMFADAVDFEMLLDATELEYRVNTGDPEKGIKGVFIRHDPSLSRYTPYQFIYGKYDTAPELQILYCKDPAIGHPFSYDVKLKLLNLMISAPASKGGCNISVGQLLKTKVLLAAFPLHTPAELQDLYDQWLGSWRAPWQQPLPSIRGYFGEKIGLYFAFIGHYTTWTIVPAFVGLVIQLHVAATSNTSSLSVPFFALFITLWATMMMEFWKRTQVEFALMWGMVGFEKNEQERPEFRGPIVKSHIDGSDICFFPKRKRDFLVYQSHAATTTLVLIVIGFVALIYYIRQEIRGGLQKSYSASTAQSLASTIASILNSIQITILNIFYSKLADFLTERENHRTDTEFEDSLITKLFMFQFVNSYASFVYVAFIQPYGSNPVPSAMSALAINLCTIFGSRLVLGALFEMVVPIIMAKRRYEKETEGTTAELTVAEIQYIQQPYDICKGPINDYAQLAIQFGYLTLWITAFPGACLLTLISNLLEMRTDAYKLLRIHRRPLPVGAEDIGAWEKIFRVIAILSVISNSALVCFTMTIFDRYGALTRVWLFICFQYFIFTCVFLYSVLIPDEPEEVGIQKSRTEFLVGKVILKVPDEEDDNFKCALTASQKSFQLHLLSQSQKNV